MKTCGSTCHFLAELIPADSRVEIDAKVNARYFTTGEVCTEDQLAQVKGHGLEPWEDAVFSARGNIVKEIGVE
ncbi:hypothetical protein GGS24DRAFT_507730 [Hypoxylon argillaceum]|nr:hypothetical protein GGS24DRAFT_507730 [Hypoxylon argillaceum]